MYEAAEKDIGSHSVRISIDALWSNSLPQQTD